MLYSYTSVSMCQSKTNKKNNKLVCSCRFFKLSYGHLDSKREKLNRRVQEVSAFKFPLMHASYKNLFDLQETEDRSLLLR